MEASAQGHVGLVRLLLKWRPDVNATDKVGVKLYFDVYIKMTGVCHRMDLPLCCKHVLVISGVLYKCSWTKEQTSTSVGL